MPAFTEFFFADRATSATHLAGVLGVDRDDVPTSFFRFVGGHGYEQTPTSINYAFV